MNHDIDQRNGVGSGGAGSASAASPNFMVCPKLGQNC